MAKTKDAEQPTVEDLQKQIAMLEQTHADVSGEQAKRIEELLADLERMKENTKDSAAQRRELISELESAQHHIRELEAQMAEYVNPDPTQAATQRPRSKARPKKPTGRYLATEPLELAVDVKDLQGKVSQGRLRIEIGRPIPESISEEVIARLEEKRLIEPEYSEG